ncbi:MAG: elongation factor 1-beta [Methanoculleaceae archaeon]
MGKVVMILNVMPESADVDLASLEESIRQNVPGVTEIRRAPIAFGLSALKVAVMAEDEEGAPDRVEEIISGIEGVASAGVEEVTLT